jgi:hypothetical protein
MRPRHPTRSAEDIMFGLGMQELLLKSIKGDEEPEKKP